jgi:hypothetical protein
MKRIFVIFSLLFLLDYFGFSEINSINEPFQNYGIFSNFNRLNNIADFSKLPGIPNCCPQFKNGTGSGINFGGIFEYFFSDNGFQVKAGFSVTNGNFTSREPVIISVNYKPTEAEFIHNIDYNLKYINIDFAYKHIFFNRLDVSIGLNSNFFVSSHFEQYEKISSTAGKVTFLDAKGVDTQKDIRNEKSGNIPQLNKIQLSANLGIGYSIPILKDKSIIFRPEISYNLTFSNMIKELNWKMNKFNLGFSLIFSTNKFFEQEIGIDNTESKKKFDDSLNKIIQANKLEKNRIDEENRLNEQKNKEKELELEKAKKDLILKEKQIAEIKKKEDEERIRLAKEKEEMIRLIEEENQRSSRNCNCFYILYFSSSDKKESERFLNQLNSKGIKNSVIKVSADKTLNTKFYRVQSECYKNLNDAVEEKLKYRKDFEVLNFESQIICDK